MSKRFGRNQKRILKSQVQELEQGIAMANGLAWEAYRCRDEALEDLRGIIETVEQVAGSHCAILDPKLMAADRAVGMISQYQLAVYEPAWSMVGREPDDILDSVNFKVAHLVPLRVLLEDRKEVLQKVLHLQLGYGSEAVYTLTYDAFDRMPPAMLAKHLLPEMVRIIQKERAKK